MARKHILDGLMAPPAAAGAEPPAPPRATKGAIGAVSRSIADLKARSVIEIDPLQIDGGGMSDRLETDPGAEADLRQSIAEYGQQVPVLVRPHPEKEGRFQIVYGRRRVLALRDLGQPVKALVRDLDDRALVLAQGQENTARRDLSFIEKVNFARQLAEAGYDRKVICDAISIDKTVVSRMLSIAERITPEVIAAIGAAPSVGRDRWLRLADLIEAAGEPAAALRAVALGDGSEARSDARFQALWDHLSARLRDRARAGAPARAAPRTIRAGDGTELGEAGFSATRMTLRLDRARSAGFETWLLEALPELHRDWLARRGRED